MISCGSAIGKKTAQPVFLILTHANRRGILLLNERKAKYMGGKVRRMAELFAAFFKIGAFTFGGGYAMIPLIQKEVVENKKWINDGDILEIVAIAESTPGPIAINAATFVGYKVAGFFGAMCATLGVVLPSFVIIAAIAGVLELFEDAKVVQYAFNGVRAGVLALIIKAMISMYKQCPKGPLSYAVMIGAFVAAAFLKINVLLVVIGCAAVGMIASLAAERRMRG